MNLLLKGICLFMFNKKIKKESIAENVNVLNNITEHTALIDNKRVCLGDIHEYLYENINDIHNNIKNKKYEKTFADLLLIQKHTFMSINRMRIHNVNKKIASKKITDDNSANKKITSANKANKKSNKANKKITSANGANKKITSANSANEKITSANNANKKCTDGNNAITNSTNTIRKKSAITVKLKILHVIY